MARLRVINLGLPKSGTTSLGKALSEAGLRVADWRIRAGQSDGDRLKRAFVGRLMYRGYFNTGDPLAMMEEFDAFSEVDIVREGLNLWPQTDWGLISAIRAHHPGAKFILTIRDAAEMSDSIGRWSNLGRSRLPKASVPGLPSGWGKSDGDRIRWIEGHTAFCRQVFGNSKDFLAYSIEDPDAKAKVSAFIGRDLPWWGIANANRNRPADQAGKESVTQ